MKIRVPASAQVTTERDVGATVIHFDSHPAVHRSRLQHKVRALRHQCATASREVAAMQAALEAFGRQLEEHRARLAPVRAETAATLKAIADGDIGEMERLRDEILRRLEG